LSGERLSFSRYAAFCFSRGISQAVEKKLSLDADAVILDLEDVVAVAEERARRDAISRR
jgi:citrate lyase beta subunit